MPNTFKCNPQVIYHRSFKNLKEIVDAYLEDYKDNVEYEIKEIKKAPFDEVLEQVGRGKFLDGVHLDHLKRLPMEALQRALSILIKYRKQIKSCKNFCELFELIHKEIEREVYGIGEMYTYDISFYLSVNLGFKPKYVYLHKGTKIGARKLGLNVNRIYIAKDEFPEEFKELEVYDIENLLCIYKNHLHQKLI